MAHSSLKIFIRTCWFLAVGEYQVQANQILAKNWKSIQGKIQEAPSKNRSKKGFFGPDGSKNGQSQKSCCNQISVLACLITTRRNFGNSLESAAVTAKRRILGSWGAYSPAHGHMATPMTPKWVFPYNFIMIESPITKKVGVRIFPETFAVIFPVSER